MTLMTMQLSPVSGAVKRVVDAAAAEGLDLTPRRFPDGTRTAEQAAAAVGVEVERIVKSLVFEVDDEAVLALVGGADRLDEDRLASAAGGTVVHRPDADRVRAATGFAIGGVAPLGITEPLRVFMDPALLEHATVWAAAGTGQDVFEVDPSRLAEVSGAAVTPIREQR